MDIKTRSKRKASAVMAFLVVSTSACATNTPAQLPANMEISANLVESTTSPPDYVPEMKDLPNPPDTTLNSGGFETQSISLGWHFLTNRKKWIYVGAKVRDYFMYWDPVTQKWEWGPNAWILFPWTAPK